MDAGPVLGVYFLFAILAIGMVLGLGRLATGRATGASNAVFIASGVLLVVFTIRMWPLLGLALLGLLGFWDFADDAVESERLILAGSVYKLWRVSCTDKVGDAENPAVFYRDAGGFCGNPAGFWGIPVGFWEDPAGGGEFSAGKFGFPVEGGGFPAGECGFPVEGGGFPAGECGFPAGGGEFPLGFSGVGAGNRWSGFGGRVSGVENQGSGVWRRNDDSPRPRRKLAAS